MTLIQQLTLLLEHFGLCVLLDNTLATPRDTKRVDWDFLRPGEMPSTDSCVLGFGTASPDGRGCAVARARPLEGIADTEFVTASYVNWFEHRRRADPGGVSAPAGAT